MKDKIQYAINKMANSALRTIIIGVKELKGESKIWINRFGVKEWEGSIWSRNRGFKNDRFARNKRYTTRRSAHGNKKL